MKIKSIGTKIAILKVILSHIISDIKINLISFLFFSNSNHYRYIKEFKSKGCAVIPNYFNKDEVEKIYQQNIQELEKVPPELIQEKIDNIKLENGVNLEKIRGSIKLKNIENSKKNLKKLFKLKPITLFSSFYSYSIFNVKKLLYSIIHGPLILYNVTHDGSFKHYTVPEGVSDEVIAGDPHIDSPIPGIKAFIALKKVDIANGPFCYFEKSNSFKHLKNFYIRLFFSEQKMIDKENEITRSLDKDLINFCENNFELYKATINPGDLVIFDTCGVHYASKLTKGQRHLMFLYY